MIQIIRHMGDREQIVFNGPHARYEAATRIEATAQTDAEAAEIRNSLRMSAQQGIDPQDVTRDPSSDWFTTQTA